MKYLLSVALVLAMAGAAIGQEFYPNPVVTETRLLSMGGPTVLYVGIYTPFKEGLYRVKSVIFSRKEETIRKDVGGWFYHGSGDHIVYECEITPRLTEPGAYVKVKLDWAEWVENER